MNKRRCQGMHAKRRARERYGLVLNREKLQAVVRTIQAGRAAFVEKQSCRISIFDVMVEGEACRVVYDRQRHQVVTFLPKGEHKP